MIRKIIIAATFATGAFAARADMPAAASAPAPGTDAVAYFSRAPLAVASNLMPYSRLDMIDYFNSGMKVGTENRVGAKYTIRRNEPLIVEYCSDDSVDVTIAVLPPREGRSDTMLMVVRTVPVPFSDSSLEFYDSKWRQASGFKAPAPALADWLVDKSRQTRAAVEDALPFMLSVITYDPVGGILTFRNTTAQYFTDDSRPAALDLLKPALRYQWDGRKFSPIDDKR